MNSNIKSLLQNQKHTRLRHHQEFKNKIVQAKELQADKEFSSELFLKLRKLPAGHSLELPRLGCIKCRLIPEYTQKSESPCENCIFNLMNHGWCITPKFCFSKCRPDHLSVYFTQKEQEDAR